MKQSFRLGIWSNFFTARAVKQWSRSPREVVQSTSLEVFKTRLDKALSNLVWPSSWPCFEKEVRLENSNSFQPHFTCELMIMGKKDPDTEPLRGKLVLQLVIWGPIPSWHNNHIFDLPSQYTILILLAAPSVLGLRHKSFAFSPVLQSFNLFKGKTVCRTKSLFVC